MKGLRFALTVVLVLGVLLVGSLAVSAQGGTWVSGITIVNEETTEAQVTVEFIWAEGQANAGQVEHTMTRTLAGKASWTIYVPSVSEIEAEFIGSAVVTSDKKVSANLNTQVPSGSGATTSNPNRVGTASGVPSDSPDLAGKLYFTQVMKAYGGWNSYLAIQNTSATAPDASVKITYYGDDGNTAGTRTVTVKPKTTFIFRQEDEASLAAGKSYSAVVEVVGGDQKLAGIANFYNAGTSNTDAQFHSYNGAGSGATKLYAPRVVKAYYGYQSGLRVQNIGTANTDITVEIKFGASSYTKTYTGVKAGAAIGMYMGSDGQIPPTLVGVTNKKGGAVITSSSQPIVATVNEDNRTEGRGVTYNAIPDGRQTSTVVFPQVLARYYGYSGGVQVQNVSTVPVDVVATFSGTGYSDVSVTRTLAAGESYEWFAPTVLKSQLDAKTPKSGGWGFNGSCTIVTSTSGGAIVGTANFSVRSDVEASDGWAANYGDSFITYNGNNR